jgi:DNA-binding CsgD family transcriptional regulator
MLTQDLRTVIPGLGATFFWADENGGLANCYDENPESHRVGQLFAQEFYNRRELGVGFQETMRGWLGVHSNEEAMGIELKAWLASDQYNLIHRPLGYSSYIFLVVHTSNRRNGLGVPQLHRGLGERPFDANERRRLAQLEPFFAHLLTSSSCPDFPLIDSGKTGLIIATAEGRPVHSSPEGRRLLFLAMQPRVSPGAVTSRLPSLPPALVRLCRNLTAVFAGDAAAEAPSLHHRNAWGGFTFRAHWLEGMTNAGGLIGIVITFREPLVVGIMRGIEHLPLTRRQSQVCQLLANGWSYAEIAKQLGISKHTAIAHARWIYDKLDIHSRSELINLLISGLQ